MYLFLFAPAVSFLFPSSVFFICYNTCPSSSALLSDFHTFLLGLLFALSFSEIEYAKYFQIFGAGLAWMYAFILLGIPFKLVLLWCFHV